MPSRMTVRRFPSGHLLALAIWLAVFAGVYLFMDSRIKPTVAEAVGAGKSGEIVIPRSRDGHYYVAGSINGKPLVFVVDTGATTVSVDREFARAAGLPKGEAATFSTAGGVIGGEIVQNQTVEAGGIRVNDISISVGMRMNSGAPALLGQNFLRYVDVLQSGDRMVLRTKPVP